MISRPLGMTGIQVSALTMGCWEIGGLAWGPMPAPEAVELVQAVADAGITAFDTAEAYGNGRSEVILGHALRDRRDEVTFITKTGYLPGVDGAQMLLDEQPQDYRATSIRRACELSRQRLQTDYIDVYLLHDPPMEAVLREEPFAELRRLQDCGEIRAWGVSSSPAVVAEAVRRWGAQVVETPFNSASPQVCGRAVSRRCCGRHWRPGAQSVCERKPDLELQSSVAPSTWVTGGTFMIRNESRPTPRWLSNWRHSRTCGTSQ